MLTIAEYQAAANVLTEWPEDMNYDELLTAIETEHHDVMICEQFENNFLSDVVEEIEGQRVAFIRHVAAMTEDLRAAIKHGDPLTIAEQLAAFEQQIGE